jgi:hypothetical protein
MKDQIPKTRNPSNLWLRIRALVVETVETVATTEAIGTATTTVGRTIATVMCVTAALAMACSDQTPPVSSKPPVAPLPIAGMYEVSGVTVDLESGNERKISGKIILNQQGETYTATFALDTLFPTERGNLEAEVIGTGTGKIDGRTLTGSAETQLIVSTVPGIDPGFAFVPRTTTRRIVSASVTTVAEDGSVQVEIESNPAQGEVYSPTRTTLRGTRVSDAAD